MSQVPKPQPAYKVAIIESKGGRDSKVVDEVYFDSDEEAHAYISDYNKNTDGQVTIRTMFAVYHGLCY